MKQLLCALYDRVAQAYYPPSCYVKQGVAVRVIVQEMRRGGEGNPLAANPGDFELWQVGEFDDELGVVDGAVRALIVRVADLVEDK